MLIRLPAVEEVLQSPAADQGRICAVDLGGTHLRVATVDTQGKFINRLKERTPLTDDPGEIVRALAKALRDCQQVSPQGRDQILSLSILVPGIVDAGTGRVIKAPNLPCLDEFHLAGALTDELHLPVILENDGNAAALGEMWQGGARGRSNFIFVTLGTGVGGGIILDGKLWRGANNSAAEIGHMSVEPFGGVACGCGSRGCLEVYASATAIVRMAREAKPRYPASCLNVGEGLTAEDVYRAGKQDDALAIEVFHRMGAYLGVGLANLINILNPEMIVIGGGVADGWDLFEKDVRHQIDEYAFPIPASQVQVVRAECGDDAGLLGAALLGFWQQSQSEVPALLSRS